MRRQAFKKMALILAAAFVLVLWALADFSAPPPAADLLKAAKAGDLTAVKALLAQEASPNAMGENGETPLMVAAELGYKDLCELLISKGADINAQDKDGKTALKYAIENKKNNVADFLRSKGAKE
jgi:ankyrin repeat protein